MADTSAVIVAREPDQRDTRNASTQDPARTRPAAWTLINQALPWLVVIGVLVAALVWTGTPKTAILRYGAYWAAAVVVPGTLVYRALRGSRGNLPEDVGFGAVTGFAVQLIGWALFVGTGLGGWLRLWPVLVLIPFLAVPRLRRHWSLRSTEPMRLPAAWAIAALMTLAVVTLALLAWAVNPLPPATHTLFGDIYYHWANAAELRRTITPQQPQMAGEPLVYHWFSDAYRGSASMLSGVPLAPVMLRLWMGPVILTAILVIAGLARQVSGVWWSGPVAAFVTIAVPAVTIWPTYSYGSFSIINWGSPTLVFSIPVQAAAVSLLVDIARGVRLGRAWVLFALLVPLATGSKSSSLPVLFGGMALAALAYWLIERRPPWALLAAFAAGLVVLAATAPTLAGGEAGAGVQFGAGFTFKPEFYWLTDEKYVPGAGGLLPQAWLHMPWGTRWALFALTFVLVLNQLGRIAGLAALLRRPMRRDMALWLLSGIVLAGWGGALLINHVANGEGYFLYSAIPAEAALTAWLLTAVAPGRRRALVVLGGLALGVVVGLAMHRFGPGRGLIGTGHLATLNPAGGKPQWSVHWRYDLLAPVGVLALVLAAGMLLWWLLRRRRAVVLAGSGAALVMAAVIGLGVDSTARGLVQPVGDAVAGRLPTGGSVGSFWVTANEARAAQWLARNAPADDIVATNVHCEAIRTTPGCISRSFWVSGMTEHAVVLEGWAYQPAVMAEHGVDGRAYYQQPAPDAERLRINDAAFTDPSPAALAQLRGRYHARWLYADTRAGVVSPLLATVATERFRAGTAVVYELTD
ncbi:hypothetical protein [Actinoplanes sp. NPDC051411]|uniref:hypothetical protein n=1 Tax=Actinoplanes sp. NPDC051411 TaxID=3155522 RepID=UPI003440ABE6